MSWIHHWRARVILLCAGLSGALSLAADPLRVCLVTRDASAAASAAPLQAALAATALLQCDSVSIVAHTANAPTLGALRSADVAIFLRGPGALAEEATTALRQFLDSGRPILVLGATREAWTAAPRFFDAALGATPGEPFAKGAPMTVINLFAHPIFTGVARFETDESFPVWSQLADDVQMIMEGTVGEETTPLGWVRRRGAGRVCHLLPAAPAVLRDLAYQRIVANAVLWLARRSIPGAQPAVQRTYLPEAHPGAIAITFPSGPGVCLDPVRGGINYIWEGDFVDLRPRWLTKQGAPARIFGNVFYAEKLWQPLRAGAPNAEPAFRFRGYTRQDGGPEFHYEVAGREVHERITALPDGDGISRRFRVAAGLSPLWLTLEPQGGAEIVATGISRDGERLSFSAAGGGEFTITIRRKTGGIAP